MKIAIVRGDFLSSWEIPNFAALWEKNDVTMFLGKQPVYKVELPPTMKLVTLFSPADLNFGKISRWKMAILNRVFIDAHLMFGLEDALKGFDVAYTSETYYGFTHQCLEAKKRGFLKSVVSHVSENTPFNNEGIWGRRAWKRQAVSEADKFVAITQGAADVLVAEGCDPKKIVRASPGVDLNHFRPREKVNGRNSTKLLFVGRLVEEKGIRDVLRMFRVVRRKFSRTELLVVGTGPLSGIVSGDGVTYLGPKSYNQMPQIYAGCDLYVHFSKGTKTWVEQYGLTLIEAMACGLPVLGLDRGSVKEVVSSGGIVVSAGKYGRMLEKLVADDLLRRKIGDRALALARKNYGAYKHGQELAKIFQETL